MQSLVYVKYLLCRMGKMHYLKVEDYVLFSGFTEDLSPGYSLSDSSEGLFQRGMGGARICGHTGWMTDWGRGTPHK